MRAQETQNMARVLLFRNALPVIATGGAKPDPALK